MPGVTTTTCSNLVIVGSGCSISGSQFCKCENNIRSSSCVSCNGKSVSLINQNPYCYGETKNNTKMFVQITNYNLQTEDTYYVFKMNDILNSHGSYQEKIRNYENIGLNNGHLTIEVWDYDLITSDDLEMEISMDLTEIFNLGNFTYSRGGLTFLVRYLDEKINEQTCSCNNCFSPNSCEECVCQCNVNLCQGKQGRCSENGCVCDLPCTGCYYDNVIGYTCPAHSSTGQSKDPVFSSTGSNIIIVSSAEKNHKINLIIILIINALIMKIIKII